MKPEIKEELREALREKRREVLRRKHDFDIADVMEVVERVLEKHSA